MIIENDSLTAMPIEYGYLCLRTYPLIYLRINPLCIRIRIVIRGSYLKIRIIVFNP